MRRFLTGYAVTYNLRHRRHGHLFQNRYKSIVCDGDSYFTELVRYIHLNPLRVGFGRAMGRSRGLRAHWGPIAAALGLIPVFSLLPTFTIWFGIAEMNKWAVVSWAVFLPILYTTSMAVCTPEHLHEKHRISKTGVSPYDSYCLFVGLKLSSIIGMLALLGAEMWSAKVGLGWLIATRGPKFDIALMHVVMVASALIVYAFWLGLTALEVSLRHRTAAKTKVGDR
jgi:ABC-type nitrate/sulfonate/bicarbonate transport system permease component